MSKHTPGPWYTTTRSSDSQGLICSEVDGRNIAVSYNPRDADLIAAAPDLLSAAETLLTDALDRDECHDEETGEMYDDWAALDEAIRKAKGD